MCGVRVYRTVSVRCVCRTVSAWCTCLSDSKCVVYLSDSKCVVCLSDSKCVVYVFVGSVEGRKTMAGKCGLTGGSVDKR